MKKVLLVVMVLMMSAFVSADLEAVLTEHIGVLESQVKGHELPTPLSTLFGDERVNVVVSFTNGEEMTIGVVTQNDAVFSLAVGELTDPTVLVSLTESTLRGIQDSDDQLGALREAFGAGKIQYEAVTFFNKIKFSFVSMFFSLLGDEPKGEEVEEAKAEEPTEEPAEEEVVEEVEEEIAEEVEEAEVEELEEEEATGNALTGGAVAELVEEDEPPRTNVLLIDGGFDVEELQISVGDTVTWENVRFDKNMKAMIIGTRNCRAMKSTLFDPGESFSYTFNEPGECFIVGGVFTRQSMKVIVR